jgi:hypothetical protein
MSKKEKRFEPPKDGIVFTKMWNSLLSQLRVKKSFNPDIHLSVLETLCTLYQDQRNLESVLELTGMTYSPGKGRNGEQLRMRPEVQQLNITRNLIHKYTAMLDLGINTDKFKRHSDNGDVNGEAKDWD